MDRPDKALRNNTPHPLYLETKVHCKQIGINRKFSERVTNLRRIGQEKYSKKVFTFTQILQTSLGVKNQVKNTHENDLIHYSEYIDYNFSFLPN